MLVAASGSWCRCYSKGYKNLPDGGGTNGDAGGIFNEDDPWKNDVEGGGGGGNNEGGGDSGGDKLLLLLLLLSLLLSLLLLLPFGSCLFLNFFNLFWISKSIPGGRGAFFISSFAMSFFPTFSFFNKEPTIVFSASNIAISSKTSSKGFILSS